MTVSLRMATTAMLLIVLLAMSTTSYAFAFFPEFGRALSSEDIKAIDELEQKQDWNGMRELAGKWLRTSEKEAGWLYLDGYALQKLDRCDEAIPQFRLALLIKTGYIDAQNELGRCLLATRRFDAAKSTFASLIGNSPNYWQAYYNLAILYVRKQDVPNARIYLEQLKSKNPAMANEIEESEIKPLESRLEQERAAAVDRVRGEKARIERERLGIEVDEARANVVAQATAVQVKSLPPEHQLAAAPPPKSLEEKLKELMRLYTTKLITKNEYRARQRELLTQQ